MKKESSPTQKMLFWWGWILILWSIYRVIFRTTLPIWFDELIAKPVVFILPVYFYITRIEKKNFFSGIDLKFKDINKDLLLAGLVGLALFFIAIIKGDLKSTFAGINKLTSQYNIFVIIGTAFATSISEEILSRGFVLKRLYGESKNMIVSSFFASILFFFLRVPILFSNDKIMGTALLGIMFTDIIFSVAISLIFLMRKNLVLPILIHALYIFSIYVFLGFS